MKFAKKLQQTLEEEDIPQEWRTAAIQYKALKKCITKVVTELEEYGLEKETLEMLLQYHKAQQNKDKLHEEQTPLETKEIASADPAIVYSFEGNLREFVPTITITLDKDKNIPMAAKLSSSTRKKLNRILHSDKAIQVVDRSKLDIKIEESDEEEEEGAEDLELELETDEANLSDSSAMKEPSLKTASPKESGASQKDLKDRRRSAQNISKYLKSRKGSVRQSPTLLGDYLEHESQPLVRVNSVGSIGSDLSSYSQSSLIWNGDMNEFYDNDSDDGYGRRPSYASSVFSQADSRAGSIQGSRAGSRAGSLYNHDGRASDSRPTSLKNYEARSERKPRDSSHLKDRFSLAVPQHNPSTNNLSLHTSPGTSPPATRDSPSLSPRAFKHSPGLSPTAVNTATTLQPVSSMVSPPIPAESAASQMLPPAMLPPPALPNGSTNESDDQPATPASPLATPISPRLMYTEDGPKMVIQLQSDSEFFHMLMNELQDLDDLKSSLKKTFEAEVLDLAKEITTVASPSIKKSDMYTWREIFQLYIEAGIFFSDHEAMAGPTSSDQAKERLRWFWDQLQKQSLISEFKNKRSQKAFVNFWNLNSELVKNHVYQELNQTAITKILKKFDKQTALTSRESFPPFIAAGPNGTASLAKTMMFVMSERLLSIVPQIDDYLCPICSSIAVKPIRLSCSHVFCVRCLVKLQRKGEDRCPLCRELNVLEADESNLDEAHLKYLKLYFPKEAKQKQQENEKEITAEQFQNINNAKCCIQ